MITRRTFVGAAGAGVAAARAVAAGEQPRRRRLAVVTTAWRERSHAWHMAERFLHGYPERGRWHRHPSGVRLLATWHPAAILRARDDRAARRQALVDDLRGVAEALLEPG